MFFLSRLIALLMFFNASNCVIELSFAAVAKLAITFSLGYGSATKIEGMKHNININNNIICDPKDCGTNK